MKSVQVSDIMTRIIVHVKPSTNLLECSKKMLRHRIKLLPLVEDVKIAGLITQRDILWAMTKKPIGELSEIKAESISPKRIVILKPHMSIDDVITRMKKTKLDKFPVTKRGELVGVLTAGDVISFHPEFYPELEEISRIKGEFQKLKRLNKRKVVPGLCDNCGDGDFLYDFNGMLVCEKCYGSL